MIPQFQTNMIPKVKMALFAFIIHTKQMTLFLKNLLSSWGIWGYLN
jgi:hypothetical protein